MCGLKYSSVVYDSVLPKQWAENLAFHPNSARGNQLSLQRPDIAQRRIHVHTMQQVGAAPLDSDPFMGFSP